MGQVTKYLYNRIGTIILLQKRTTLGVNVRFALNCGRTCRLQRNYQPIIYQAISWVDHFRLVLSRKTWLRTLGRDACTQASPQIYLFSILRFKNFPCLPSERSNEINIFFDVAKLRSEACQIFIVSLLKRLCAQRRGPQRREDTRHERFEIVKNTFFYLWISYPFYRQAYLLLTEFF